MKNSGRKGMTLVEVIISMAILGIMTIVFLNVFTSGYIGVLSAGERTEVGYKAQQTVEESLTPIGIGSKIITIEFPDGPSIEIDGSEIEKEVNSGEQNIKITTFVPNP